MVEFFAKDPSQSAFYFTYQQKRLGQLPELYADISCRYNSTDGAS
jgi:hypothetical protein